MKFKIKQKDSSNINYHDILMKCSLKSAKFTTKDDYVLLDDEHINRNLRQCVKTLKKRFNKKNFKKNIRQAVDFKQFRYIKQVLQKDEAFSLKN